LQRRRLYGGAFGGAVARGRARANIPLYRRTRWAAAAGVRRRSLRAGGRRLRAARYIANQRSGGFLGIEKKFYDTGLTSAALTAPTDATGGEHDPSSTSMISTPAQGDSEQNRDGKRIVIKSVQITGVVRCASQTDQTVSQNATGAVFA